MFGKFLNNSCEPINNLLREARGKPIIALMERIIKYVLQIGIAKRKGLSRFDNVLMSSILKIIQK